MQVGVNPGLQTRKKFRSPLSFVQNGAVRKAGEKAARIGFLHEPDIRIFQRQIGFVRESSLGEGRLARLPGAGVVCGGVLPD